MSRHLPFSRAVADELRAQSGRLAQLSWNLDSALSMHRKAKAGYRSSPLTGDFPWDQSATLVHVAEASTEGLQALLDIGVPLSAIKHRQAHLD